MWEIGINIMSINQRKRPNMRKEFQLVSGEWITLKEADARKMFHKTVNIKIASARLTIHFTRNNATSRFKTFEDVCHYPKVKTWLRKPIVSNPGTDLFDLLNSLMPVRSV